MNEEDYNNTQMNLSNAELGNAHLQQAEQMAMVEERNKGLIKEQLDLNEELEKLDHLLRGHVQRRNEHGELRWYNPKNNDNVLLSEAGINLVLNTIQWYLNKNTLLSNYDESTINRKMEDFSNALADSLFMNYQKYFLYPTNEECFEALDQRLKKRLKDRIESAQLRNIKINKDEEWNKLVSEIDPSREVIKIREQIIKDKLKMYELIMRVIQDTVHSTYNRAFMGQERKTLRQHTHVSETMNPTSDSNRKSTGIFGSYKER